MPSAAVEAAVRRWAAPAAFLLAVTIAVLLVRAGLEGPHSTAHRNPQPRPTTSTATSTTTPRRPARYYVIKTGDTLDGVALAEHTTVEKLRTLNPGVDPTTLHVGQRIRVA